MTTTSDGTPAPARIDLNADLGEGVTDDAGLLAVVTSANVACGFHAGDLEVMRAVCDAAAGRGVVVGAQVSYLDREAFGRRPMDVAEGVLLAWVAEQVGTLREVARAAGTDVAYVKPHGALYHRVVDDPVQAAAVLDGSDDLPVLGLPGSVLLSLAAQRGRLDVPEGFPDRAYTPEGRLVSRDEPGAVVADRGTVATNAVALAAGGAVRTVCVHGDSPGAVATAYAVRAALVGAGIAVIPWIEQR
ncbi:MAG TPA: 5-oxoprolinase subunit PxpA [Marmoricola sp.]